MVSSLSVSFIDLHEYTIHISDEMILNACWSITIKTEYIYAIFQFIFFKADPVITDERNLGKY